MYTVVQHRIKDAHNAFSRGQQLIENEGAPVDTRVLQFYPSQDGSSVTCLWECGSVASVQAYVDAVLGDSSENTYYAVDAENAFAEAPTDLRSSR